MGAGLYTDRAAPRLLSTVYFLLSPFFLTAHGPLIAGHCRAAAWGRPRAEGQTDLSRIREKEAANQGFPDFERRIQAYHEIRIPGKEVQANEQAR